MVELQRYFSKEKDSNYLFLDKNDIYHITKVMRYQNGDLIEIVYDNKLYISKIEKEKNDIKFSIIKEGDNFNLNIPYVTMIIPFLKETKIDLILQKGTEMGVSHFILCPMERCMVKISQCKVEMKLNRWNKICKEASEQSKRLDIPKLEIIDNISNLKMLEGHNFTCSTQEKEKNIKNVLKSIKSCDKINLVIGPEGGISPKEEELLNNIGFQSISLGKLIMRVESVPLFLMSVINYAYME